MGKFIITIQGQTFSTKKSLEEKCKKILNSYKSGDRLNLFDEEFMISFFLQLAKSTKLKGKNIELVYVRKSAHFPNLQFWIKREDGTEITKFTDSALVESFIQYHNSHTHLRLITVEENRKRKKKKQSKPKLSN